MYFKYTPVPALRRNATSLRSRRFFHNLSVAVLAIILCGHGCGFHLRGSSPVALRFSGVLSSKQALRK